MAGSDERIDIQEIAKLREVMERFGFSHNEVVREIEDFSRMNIEEALIYGRQCVKALPHLDEEMRDNLLISLTEIAFVDSIYNETQLRMLDSVKRRLNWEGNERMLNDAN